MFRVKEAEVNPRLAWAMLALLVAILVATAVTAWLIWMLYLEQRTITELANGHPGANTELLRALPSQLRWQSALAVIVMVILAATALALVVIRRAYLINRQMLRQVKLLAGDIFASMIQGVVTTDCEGTVTNINHRGCELLGVGVGCVGAPVAAISRPEVPLSELSREVLKSLGPVSGRDFAAHRNGNTQRLQADCHLLRDPNGTVLGTVVHLRDVTERLLIEDRMRRMERYMGIGSLAAGLQHEIKNPLMALSLHVQLLEERVASQHGADVDEMLGVLKTEVMRLNGVLESFGDFAALRSLSLQPTNVTQLIDKAARLVRPQADIQKVRISVVPPESSLPPVTLDPAKFEQVLLNLIINALEAMPDGGELTIRTVWGDGKLSVEVADTGGGIPPDVQPLIFDPYFTTKSDGVGMGLAWSEKLVQQHQGHIEFQTGPQGTVFKVTVPANP